MSLSGRILPQREGFLLQRVLLRFPYNRFLKACLHCEADLEPASCESETSQLLWMNSLPGCSHFCNSSAFLHSNLATKLVVLGCKECSRAVSFCWPLLQVLVFPSEGKIGYLMLECSPEELVWLRCSAVNPCAVALLAVPPCKWTTRVR